jgi:hypothetical protein
MLRNRELRQFALLFSLMAAAVAMLGFAMNTRRESLPLLLPPPLAQRFSCLPEPGTKYCAHLESDRPGAS